jgi:hypothetical protein
MGILLNAGPIARSVREHRDKFIYVKENILMNTTKILSVLLLCGTLLFANGCSSSSSDPTTPATFSILGAWDYTMLTGNNTWDTGTFTFTGSSESGTYTQVNWYNVTYTGTYTVSGVDVELDGGENLSGTFSDASNMGGTWTSDDGSESGTWTAVKQ